ncbi:MAG: cytochrome c oxidase assembly factor Coa1 family protein [Desulfobacterales bacterium]|nr:cytochrome c oxidase assembly factor Coa1 family protein [Desulfobacterales bacterium]
MEIQSPPPLPGQRQTPSATWWQRNWKWFVPVCFGVVVLVVGFIVGILALVFGMMKSSDAYKDALAMAQENQYVQEALGSPIEAGLLVMGNINVNGSSGHADLAIPVSGPYGEGTIYVVASKSAGRWTLLNLVTEIAATNERIDLLADHLDHRR